MGFSRDATTAIIRALQLNEADRNIYESIDFISPDTRAIVRGEMKSILRKGGTLPDAVSRTQLCTRQAKFYLHRLKDQYNAALRAEMQACSNAFLIARSKGVKEFDSSRFFGVETILCVSYLASQFQSTRAYLIEKAPTEVNQTPIERALQQINDALTRSDLIHLHQKLVDNSMLERLNANPFALNVCEAVMTLIECQKFYMFTEEIIDLLFRNARFMSKAASVFPLLNRKFQASYQNIKLVIEYSHLAEHIKNIIKPPFAPIKTFINFIDILHDVRAAVVDEPFMHNAEAFLNMLQQRLADHSTLAIKLKGFDTSDIMSLAMECVRRRINLVDALEDASALSEQNFKRLILEIAEIPEPECCHSPFTFFRTKILGDSQPYQQRFDIILNRLQPKNEERRADCCALM